MKVLHVINSMATGGAEKLIAQSLPAFEKLGIGTGLLLLDGSDHPFLAELRQKFSGPIYHRGSKSPYSPAHIFRIIPMLSRYDIVHVHLFPSLYWAAAAKWLSLSGTKLIFTEHNTHNRRREKPLFKILDRVVYRAYSAITCITQDAMKALAVHMGSDKKLSVVENGIDLEAIEQAVPAQRRTIDASLAESDKLIVMVAGFRAQKDQHTAIAAMQMLPSHVRLLLVGDGPRKSECMALAKSLGLGDRVIFTGIRADVPAILKASDVAVLSSHWEGFGLAAVESMAAGIPFVASDVAGLADVAGGAGILFEKGNADALAKIIERLLSDPEFYKTTAEACRNRALKYDISRMAKSFAALYQNILK